MPDDKKPRPILNLKAEAVNQPQSPRQDAPKQDGSSPNSAGRSDANSKRIPVGRQLSSSADRPRKKGGVLGYVLAGVVGGAIAAGGGYGAVTNGLVNVSGASDDLRRLENRMVELDRAVRNQRTQNPTSTLSASSAGSDVNELRARLDGIVDAARTLDETVRTLNARADALEQRSGDGAQSAAVADVSRRLASIEQTLDTVNKAQSERQIESRSAAVTLALSNLKRAIGEGRAYAGELSAVGNLTPSKLPLDQLAAFKDTGIPTLAALQREFPNISRKAIEKHYRGANGTLVGEVFSRAKAAIQVKSADGTGTTIEAIMGRMETALKAGSLRGVVMEGQTVQGPALDELRPWLAQVEARLGAEETLKKIDQDLLAVLTRPAPRRP